MKSMDKILKQAQELKEYLEPESIDERIRALNALENLLATINKRYDR